MNPAIRALREAPPPHPAIGARLKRRIEQQNRASRSPFAGLLGALALGLMLAALYNPQTPASLSSTNADGGFSSAPRFSTHRAPAALDGGLLAEAGILED